MELLRKSTTIIFLIIAIGVNAQNNSLATAFGKSYDFEANKKYSEAINTLNAVYDANSYEINLRLGWLNYAAGKYKESINFYKIAITLMPVATEPLWSIISPLAALEQWTELESTYFAILKLDPKNSLVHYRLGSIYYYRKDYINAKIYFDISLNLYPFDYNNLIMSAWNNYFLENKKEASILFNKVLLYKPNDKSALEGLSLIK